MSILNGAGELLYSNDDYAGEGQCENEKHARIEVKKLPSGTYYVVSEGSVDNGRITTTIEAPNFSDALCTTEGQPCVITLTPQMISPNCTPVIIFARYSILTISGILHFIYLMASLLIKPTCSHCRSMTESTANLNFGFR